MTTFAVVMAGGSGTRLWPCSRRDRPKQLLPLLGERSLLQATVDRLAPHVPPARMFVLTNRAYVDDARAQLPDLPDGHVVGEPAALGTAAAVGLGVALVHARDPGAVMLVLPADHVIEPVDRFHHDLARAEAVARCGYLVTFGIPPAGPETGYGYIALGQRLDGDGEAFAVERFVEKPDRATAEAYVAGGRHVWNSGMFAWTVRAIETALARCLPALAEQVDRIATAALGDPELFDTHLAAIWRDIADRTTIDYGVMERSDRVACIPATFTWSDVGSWAALGDVLAADAAGNVVTGHHLGVDTARCVIRAEGGRLVATIGLNDLVIVDTPDALLVCPRDRAQDVREIVARLAGPDAALA